MIHGRIVAGEDTRVKRAGTAYVTPMRVRWLLLWAAMGPALLVPARARAADPSPAAEDAQPDLPRAVALDLYQRESKSRAVAIGMSIVLPGAGSVYAHDLPGAAVTWTLLGAGVGLIAWTSLNPTRQGDISGPSVPMLLGGLVLITAAELHSIVNAYLATIAYNDRLAGRLGLPTDVAFGMAPLPAGRAQAWGPTVSFRF